MTRPTGWLEPGALPYSDRETSLQAAKDARSGADAIRTRVLTYVRSCRSRGATDDEIEVALNLPHQTASARRRELVLAGLVKPDGSRRMTRTGGMAQVWRAVPPPDDPVQGSLL